MTAARERDVVVVGAGVVGAAIARELARFELGVVAARGRPRRRRRHEQGEHRDPAHRLRRQARHARGAARPPRLRAARRRTPARSASRSSARARCSSRGTTSSSPRCRASRRRARENGYDDLREVDADELYAREPHLGPGARGALEVPDERIVCPFTPPLAFATEAVLAGVRAAPRRARRRRSTRLTARRLRACDVARRADPHALPRQRRRPAQRRGPPHGRPRRLHRHAAARRADRLRQARPPARAPHPPAVPTATTKGVLDRPDGLRQRHARPDRRRHRRQDGDRHRRATGLARLRAEGRRIMPALLDHEVTAVYAGLRAATEHADYRHRGPRATTATPARAGIRSTGLTASMAIAEHVRERARRRRPRARARAPRRAPDAADAEPRRGVPAARTRRPSGSRPTPSTAASSASASASPRGEIRDALASPIPPVDARRPAPPHPRAHGPLPGLLLRRARRRAARERRRDVSARRRRRRSAAGRPGLAAAIELRRRGVGRRASCSSASPRPGGIPRHADHQGFGARDLRRVLRGPAYARALAELARARRRRDPDRDDGRPGWTADGALEVTAPARPRDARARAAVVLATGCRERPRAARLVPGIAPGGRHDDGHAAAARPPAATGASGRRAVVVGAEHVSFSAVATLAEGGASTVAMVTEHAAPPVVRGRSARGAALRYRAPLHTAHARSPRSTGASASRPSTLDDLDDRRDAPRRVRHRRLHRRLDPRPRARGARRHRRSTPARAGPSVDAALRTTRPGVFAAGNLDHGAEAADVAALARPSRRRGAPRRTCATRRRGPRARAGRGARRRCTGSPRTRSRRAPARPPRRRFAAARARVPRRRRDRRRPGRPHAVARAAARGWPAGPLGRAARGLDSAAAGRPARGGPGRACACWQRRARTNRYGRATMNLDELRADASAGRTDTVLLVLTDMQGRLQGKRMTARHFLDEVVEHGAEACNYLLAVDVDMNTVDGYEMSLVGARLRRLRDAPRPLDPAPRAVARGHGAVPRRHRVGRPPPGRRLAAPDPAPPDRAPRRARLGGVRRHRARVHGLPTTPTSRRGTAATATSPRPTATTSTTRCSAPPASSRSSAASATR